MEFTFLPWKMDVDIEGTKKFYESNDLSDKKKNNESCIRRLSQKQLEFFEKLGVDLSHARILRNRFKCGKIKNIYEIYFLLKGTLKSITDFQAEVYADEEVFGQEILNQVEVKKFDMPDAFGDSEAPNKIDGMSVSFKHPALTFVEDKYQKWDCGYICGVALLKKEYDFSEKVEGQKLKREDLPPVLYGLHDVHIKKIKIHNVNHSSGNVTFVLKKGFYKNEEEGTYVKGSVLFENVDFDFANVYVMNIKGANYGKIKGRKYSLKKFIKKYPEADIEIVDEVYGYHMSKFSGFLYTERKTCEIMIELYHEGGMYYVIP